MAAAPTGTDPVETHVRAFERIDSTDEFREGTPALADDVLANGWSHENFGRVVIGDDTDWDSAAIDNRSWRFRLNAWTFLGQPLAAYDRTGDRRYLEWSVRAAVSWARGFPEFVDDNDAWYDMAVGLRGHRLGYLIDALANMPRSEVGDDLEVLLAIADQHFAAYATESLFAAHSNHGLYFAVGQAALARRVGDRPSADGHAEQAQERIKALLERQFAADGIHREHSPAYHEMILQTTDGIVDAGLVEMPEAQAMFDAAAEALAWFVTPGGTLAQFGDTAQGSVVKGDPLRWRAPAMRHAATRGSLGTAPTATTRVFPLGGYWVAKDAWWDSEGAANAGSYVALTAAFHSRVHKHADDLSLVWWDRGQEILVDGGRYGYLGALDPKDPARAQGFFYSAPERQFVESTRAHNTVQIDDLDFLRRNVTPYGSAIVSSHEVEDVSAVVAEVTHFGSVVHTRVVATVPSRWMLVFDKLRTTDGARRRFTQRFAFAPECDVSAVASGLRVTVPGGSELAVTTLDGARVLEPVRGATDPLLGWTSRKDRELVEATAAGFERAHVSFATFATLFNSADAGVSARRERYAGTGGGDAIVIDGGDVSWRLGLGPFGGANAHAVAITRTADEQS